MAFLLLEQHLNTNVFSSAESNPDGVGTYGNEFKQLKHILMENQCYG